MSSTQFHKEYQVGGLLNNKWSEVLGAERLDLSVEQSELGFGGSLKTEDTPSKNQSLEETSLMK